MHNRQVNLRKRKKKGSVKNVKTKQIHSARKKKHDTISTTLEIQTWRKMNAMNCTDIFTAFIYT